MNKLICLVMLFTISFFVAFPANAAKPRLFPTDVIVTKVYGAKFGYKVVQNINKTVTSKASVSKRLAASVSVKQNKVGVSHSARVVIAKRNRIAHNDVGKAAVLVYKHELEKSIARSIAATASNSPAVLGAATVR